MRQGPCILYLLSKYDVGANGIRGIAPRSYRSLGTCSKHTSSMDLGGGVSNWLRVIRDASGRAGKLGPLVFRLASLPLDHPSSPHLAEGALSRLVDETCPCGILNCSACSASWFCSWELTALWKAQASFLFASWMMQMEQGTGSPTFFIVPSSSSFHPQTTSSDQSVLVKGGIHKIHPAETLEIPKLSLYLGVAKKP